MIVKMDVTDRYKNNTYNGRLYFLLRKKVKLRNMKNAITPLILKHIIDNINI